MNLTKTTLENPKDGQAFRIGNQDWIIEKIFNLDSKPGMKEFMARRGLNASLTIRKPNGKALYNVPHHTDNSVWEYEIKRV